MTLESLIHVGGILNSLIIILLIMSQNDSSKDFLVGLNKNKSGQNSLQNFTGLFLIFQLSFLLLENKKD